MSLKEERCWFGFFVDENEWNEILDRLRKYWWYCDGQNHDVILRSWVEKVPLLTAVEDPSLKLTIKESEINT